MASVQSSYERPGGDDPLVYCCPTCLRVELNSYEGWLWHLGSREHQINHMRTSEPFFNPSGPGRVEILQRCVDVHDILGLQARKLLEYFKTWGEIEDFSYWYKNQGEDGKAVRCVVLYREKDSVEACIKEDEHKLEGQGIRVQQYRNNNNRSRGQRETYDSSGNNRGESRNSGSYSDNGGESRKRKSGNDNGSNETTGFKNARYY